MLSTASSTPPSQQYWLDRQWIHNNYTQLVSAHANEWVAVHRGTVLSSGRDLGVVEDSARAQCPSADIVFQFIDDGSLTF
jgi:hypothetical protein